MKGTLGDLVLNIDEGLSCQRFGDHTVEGGQFSSERDLVVPLLLLDHGDNLFVGLELFQRLVESIN